MRSSGGKKTVTGTKKRAQKAAIQVGGLKAPEMIQNKYKAPDRSKFTSKTNTSQQHLIPPQNKSSINRADSPSSNEGVEMIKVADIPPSARQQEANHPSWTNIIQSHIIYSPNESAKPGHDESDQAFHFLQWDPKPYKMGMRGDNISERGLENLKETLAPQLDPSQPIKCDEIKIEMIKEKEDSRDGGYLCQEVRERTRQIKKSVHKYHKFMDEEFSEHGIRNIFGRRLQKVTLPWDKMVDSQIKTYNIDEKLYFVVTGFEKGKLTEGQKSAQGRAILKIYKLVREPAYELKELKSVTLNNYQFNYMNYKNTRPVAFNNNCIYWILLTNNKIDKKVEKQLYKYDLKKEEATLIDTLEEKEFPKAPDGSHMFAATVMFSTIGNPESMDHSYFMKYTFANVYYRTFPDEDQQQSERNPTKTSMRSIINLDSRKEQQNQNKSQFEELQDCEHELWVVNQRSREQFDINQIQAKIRTQQEDDQKQYMLAKPFYFYSFDQKVGYSGNGSYTLEKDKFSVGDSRNKLQILAKVYGEKNYFVEQDDIVDTNKEMDDKLQSINIIDDSNFNKFIVLMINGEEMILKIYNNINEIKMRKYDFKQLHNYTKYARMEAWGSKLTRQYNNVYVKNNHLDQRWVYYIDDKGGWNGGQDKKKHLLTDDYKYKVYDIVEGKFKYDIARIENISDNSQLRFRLENSRKNGLFLCLHKISDDVEMARILIMRQTNMEKHRLSCVSWSSEQYTIDDGKGNYSGYVCQEFQFSQLNQFRNIAKNLVFRVCWNKDNIESTSYPVKTELIGQKLILFDNVHFSWGNRNWMYPMYSDGGKIIGVCWIQTGEFHVKNKKTDIFYEMPNLRDSDYQFQTSLMKSAHKRYVRQTASGLQGMTVIDARIGYRLANKIKYFDHSEIMTLLTDEIKSVVNMVPISNEKEKLFTLRFNIEDYDPFQPLEIFGRQCIADFFLHDPEIIRKLVEKADPELDRGYQYHNSILQNWIEKRQDKLKYVNYFLENEILRERHEIIKDMFGSTPIKICFSTKEQESNNKNQNEEGGCGTACCNFIEKFRNGDNKIQMSANFKLSGEIITQHILDKDMSNGEYQIILNSMNVLLKNQVNFSSFFEIQSNEMYYDNKKQSYCTPLFINDLPESSRDKAVIRLLGVKSGTFFDKHNDTDFMFKIFNAFDQEIDHEEQKASGHNQYHAHMDDSIDKESMTHKITHFFEDKAYKGEKSGTIRRVKHYYVDYSGIELQRKMRQVLKDKRVSYSFDYYQLALQMKRINSQYYLDIEKHECLKVIIDALFTNTHKFFYFQITLYAFYVLPMLLQIFYYDNANATDADVAGVKFCNQIAFYVSVVFFILDALHIYLVDASENKQGWRNKFSLLWFPTQFIYYSIRMNNPSVKAPMVYYADLQKEGDEGTVFAVAILNYLLIMIIFSKLLFFMKVSQYFGTIIQLLDATFAKIQGFLFFFFMLITMQSALCKVIGFDVTDTENKQKPRFQTFFIQTFNNAIANFQDFSYDYVKEDMWKTNQNKANILETLIWLTYFVNVVIFNMCLCNFLLAYIASSYEEILENEEETLYMQRCELNSNYYLLVAFFMKKLSWFGQFEPFNIFMLSAHDKEQLNENPAVAKTQSSLGQVKRIKEAIKEESNITRTEIETLKTYTRSELDTLKAQISQLSQDVKIIGQALRR